MSHLLVFLFIVCAHPVNANQGHNDFVITKVTNRIYIAHPGRVRRINSTSTIVVGDSFVVVIESQTDEATAGRLIKDIRQKISNLPIKYLIFSHSHSDHTLGAGAFLKENPALIIIAHQWTADHIAQYGREEKQTWANLVQQKAIEAAKSDRPGSTGTGIVDDLTAYYRDILASPVIVPNLYFSDSLTIAGKGLEIQLKFLGKGHTPGDIVAFIPKEKFLVAGDLVHDFEPLFADGDPDSWIAILEKIRTWNFDSFVGGHGDFHKGKWVLEAWLAYMKELKAKTLDALQKEQTSKTFLTNLTLDSFSSLQNGYGDRIQQFRTGYMDFWTGPLLDAVRDEAGILWRFYSRAKILTAPNASPGRPQE